MKKHTFFLISIVYCLISLISFEAAAREGDTINVPRIIQYPVIDGSGTDLCWDSAAWNSMPYVWIPYGTKVSAADFTGRFKTVWNEQQNLMYFLFEITDDKFVNGYEFSSGSANYGNYWAFDDVEIFIDENHSGGIHQTNNNAFAYHITGGNNSVEYDAIDMWSNTIVNYRDHFPEFKRGKNGNVYTWEFSLMVLTDKFTPTDVPADFKSTLQVGKRMGFSVAYCDNDNSAVNPVRDHFIASKYQTQAESNNSYINASIFGVMNLVNEPTVNPAIGVIQEVSEMTQLNVFPNPVGEFADVSFINNYIGMVEISVFNSTGQLISNTKTDKSQPRFEQKLDFIKITSGIYLISIVAGNDQIFAKVVK
jgi:hypothetical protein